MSILRSATLRWPIDVAPASPRFQGRSRALRRHRRTYGAHAWPSPANRDFSAARLRATRLPRSWYARDALAAARNLIGCFLVHEGRDGAPPRVARIVYEKAPGNFVCSAILGARTVASENRVPLKQRRRPAARWCQRYHQRATCKRRTGMGVAYKQIFNDDNPHRSRRATPSSQASATRRYIRETSHAAATATPILRRR